METRMQGQWLNKLFLVSCVLAVVASTANHAEAKVRCSAVVNDETREVSVFKNPSISSQVIGTLSPGSKVSMNGFPNQYASISYNSKQGYVLARYLNYSCSQASVSRNNSQYRYSDAASSKTSVQSSGIYMSNPYSTITISPSGSIHIHTSK